MVNYFIDDGMIPGIIFIRTRNEQEGLGHSYVGAPLPNSIIPSEGRAATEKRLEFLGFNTSEGRSGSPGSA